MSLRIESRRVGLVRLEMLSKRHEESQQEYQKIPPESKQRLRLQFNGNFKCIHLIQHCECAKNEARRFLASLNPFNAIQVSTAVKSGQLGTTNGRLQHTNMGRKCQLIRAARTLLCARAPFLAALQVN